jgi:hypothetical protein
VPVHGDPVEREVEHRVEGWHDAQLRVLHGAIGGHVGSADQPSTSASIHAGNP